MLQSIPCLLKLAPNDSKPKLSQKRLQASLQQMTLKLLSTATLLVIFMPKQVSPEARLNHILYEQKQLVTELKSATPARQVQIEAQIVALHEEQSHLLQAQGELNCFIYTTSSSLGTGWIEEERNYDGKVRQYQYGYYQAGKSNRQYVPTALVGNVQEMIASGSKPNVIVNFLEQTKIGQLRPSLLVTR